MFKHTVIRRSLATGLAIGAASFPGAAVAMPIDGPHPQVASSPAVAPSDQRQLDGLQRTYSQWVAARGGWPSAAVTVPASATSPGGFHWDDAGIGAAGAALLLGSGAAAAIAVRRRRAHREDHPCCAPPLPTLVRPG